MVVLGTDLVHDVTPIWLHQSPTGDGVVTAIGKGVETSNLVFGNVRWMSRNMSTAIKQLNLAADVARDTQFMSRLVESCPGVVRVHVEGGVLDVDDMNDLRLAEELISNAEREY